MGALKPKCFTFDGLNVFNDHRPAICGRCFKLSLSDGSLKDKSCD